MCSLHDFSAPYVELTPKTKHTNKKFLNNFILSPFSRETALHKQDTAGLPGL